MTAVPRSARQRRAHIWWLCVRGTLASAAALSLALFGLTLELEPVKEPMRPLPPISTPMTSSGPTPPSSTPGR
ncbi:MULTISPECIES: hypothetical protein [Nocardia]|uniref:hypothetical protein n=1 Tax=Nocardia TaxID=1817 RepID=UPI001300783E|nr:MULTISPECIES: hypothetical protein [Nocardia]